MCLWCVIAGIYTFITSVEKPVSHKSFLNEQDVCPTVPQLNIKLTSFLLLVQISFYVLYSSCFLLSLHMLFNTHSHITAHTPSGNGHCSSTWKNFSRKSKFKNRSVGFCTNTLDRYYCKQAVSGILL